MLGHGQNHLAVAGGYAVDTPCPEISLCNLCVLCVSVVVVWCIPITTETQRTQRLHSEAYGVPTRYREVVLTVPKSGAE